MCMLNECIYKDWKMRKLFVIYMVVLLVCVCINKEDLVDLNLFDMLVVWVNFVFMCVYESEYFLFLDLWVD